MEILKKNKKEVLIEFKGGYYVISSEKDREYLKEYLKLELLDEILDNMIDNSSFQKARRFYKSIFILQFVLLITLICLIPFIILEFYIPFINIFEDEEFDYIIINSLMLFQIIILIIFLVIKFKFFSPLFKDLLDKLIKDMQAKFFKAQFMVNNINGGFDLLLRVVLYQNSKIKEIDMDYYDYINYNNPEVEDFYLKKNPFHYDPFEKKLKIN